MKYSLKDNFCFFHRYGKNYRCLLHQGSKNPVLQEYTCLFIIQVYHSLLNSSKTGYFSEITPNSDMGSTDKNPYLNSGYSLRNVKKNQKYRFYMALLLVFMIDPTYL